MPQKKHEAEEIVAKLRQVDVLLSQGRPDRWPTGFTVNGFDLRPSPSFDFSFKRHGTTRAS